MVDINKGISDIDKKLSVVIGLLVRIANAGSNPTLKEQVRYLSSSRLTSAEIAGILGKTVSHISKELSGLKNKHKHG